MPKTKKRGRIHDPPREGGIKTFDGKRYQYHTIAITKKGALNEVKKLRERGYWARILKWELYGYVIYKRKRPTYRRQASIRQRTPRITPKTPRLR